MGSLFEEKDSFFGQIELTLRHDVVIFIKGHFDSFAQYFSGVAVAPTCPRLLAMGVHSRMAKKRRTTRSMRTHERTDDDETNKRNAGSTFFSASFGVLNEMTATTLTRTLRGGPEQRYLAGIQHIASHARQGLQVAIHGGVRILAGLFFPALPSPSPPLSGIGFLPGIIPTIRDLFLEVSSTDGACGLLKLLKAPLRKMLERAEMPGATAADIFSAAHATATRSSSRHQASQHSLPFTAAAAEALARLVQVMRADGSTPFFFGDPLVVEAYGIVPGPGGRDTLIDYLLQEVVRMLQAKATQLDNLASQILNDLGLSTNKQTMTPNTIAALHLLKRLILCQDPLRCPPVALQLMINQLGLGSIVLLASLRGFFARLSLVMCFQGHQSPLSTVTPRELGNRARLLDRYLDVLDDVGTHIETVLFGGIGGPDSLFSPDLPDPVVDHPFGRTPPTRARDRRRNRSDSDSDDDAAADDDDDNDDNDNDDDDDGDDDDDDDDGDGDLANVFTALPFCPLFKLGSARLANLELLPALVVAASHSLSDSVLAGPDPSNSIPETLFSQLLRILALGIGMRIDPTFSPSSAPFFAAFVDARVYDPQAQPHVDLFSLLHTPLVHYRPVPVTGAPAGPATAATSMSISDSGSDSEDSSAFAAAQTLAGFAAPPAPSSSFATAASSSSSSSSPAASSSSAASAAPHHLPLPPPQVVPGPALALVPAVQPAPISTYTLRGFGSLSPDDAFVSVSRHFVYTTDHKWGFRSRTLSETHTWLDLIRGATSRPGQQTPRVFAPPFTPTSPFNANLSLIWTSGDLEKLLEAARAAAPASVSNNNQFVCETPTTARSVDPRFQFTIAKVKDVSAHASLAHIGVGQPFAIVTTPSNVTTCLQTGGSDVNIDIPAGTLLRCVKPAASPAGSRLAGSNGASSSSSPPPRPHHAMTKPYTKGLVVAKVGSVYHKVEVVFSGDHVAVVPRVAYDSGIVATDGVALHVHVVPTIVCFSKKMARSIDNKGGRKKTSDYGQGVDSGSVETMMEEMVKLVGQEEATAMIQRFAKYIVAIDPGHIIELACVGGALADHVSLVNGRLIHTPHTFRSGGKNRVGLKTWTRKQGRHSGGDEYFLAYERAVSAQVVIDFSADLAVVAGPLSPVQVAVQARALAARRLVQGTTFATQTTLTLQELDAALGQRLQAWPTKALDSTTYIRATHLTLLHRRITNDRLLESLLLDQIHTETYAFRPLSRSARSRDRRGLSIILPNRFPRVKRVFHLNGTPIRLGRAGLAGRMLRVVRLSFERRRERAMIKFMEDVVSSIGPPSSSSSSSSSPPSSSSTTATTTTATTATTAAAGCRCGLCV